LNISVYHTLNLGRVSLLACTLSLSRCGRTRRRHFCRLVCTPPPPLDSSFLVNVLSRSSALTCVCRSCPSVDRAGWLLEEESRYARCCTFTFLDCSIAPLSLCWPCAGCERVVPTISALVPHDEPYPLLVSPRSPLTVRRRKFSQLGGALHMPAWLCLAEWDWVSSCVSANLIPTPVL
jgi:hypothetical protein